MKKLLIFIGLFTAFNCFSSTPQNSSRTYISDMFKAISSFFNSKPAEHDNSCSSQSQNLWQPHAFSVSVESLTPEQKASDRNDSRLHDRTCKLICQKYRLTDATQTIEIDDKEYWSMKELALRELYHEEYFDRTYAEGWQRKINEQLEQLKRDFPNGKPISFSYNPQALLFKKNYYDESDFLLKKFEWSHLERDFIEQIERDLAEQKKDNNSSSDD